MGFFQQVVWDNLFRFAYPVTFIGALYFSLSNLFDIKLIDPISHPNLVFILNIFIGFSALLSISSWYHTDISFINPVTSYIDLNAKDTIDDIKSGI